MKESSVLGLAVLFALTTGGAAKEEVPSNGEFTPLELVRIIPMPDVQGRFNHSLWTQKPLRQIQFALKVIW
jgi:hypothetical protein